MSRYERLPRYRGYLVFLLATILTVNILDSTALGLVLQNIKTALRLSDVQLGFLTGIAYSAFYSTVGVPIGRWADRGDRVAIIALTTALWGVMVMLVGVTRSFGELLLVRVGVAVGEAGCIPAAYSLIADYFAREERPRAISKYYLGGSVGLILGYVAGGWLNHNYGWRIMFVCLGLPSVVIAPLAWCTLSEPRRMAGGSGGGSAGSAEVPGLWHASRMLWRNRTFRFVLSVQCLLYFFGSGLGVWQASFFVRSYGINSEALGLYLALAYGVGGLVGTYTGGYLASQYAPKDERRQFRILACCQIVIAVVAGLTYTLRSPLVSMMLLGLTIAGGTLQAGPVSATTQTVIPERVRALALCVIFLFANLLGAGLGPLFVGALSDALHPQFGVDSLRYALFAMCPVYLVAGWLLWRASETVGADTEAVAHVGPT